MSYVCVIFDPTRSQAQRTVFLVSIWVARYAQLCSHNSAGAKESNVSHSLALPGSVTHAPALPSKDAACCEALS